MEKSLKIIQTVAKVAKVVCSIVFVLVIIGTVCSSVLLVFASIFGRLSMFEEILSNMGNFDSKAMTPKLYLSLMISIISCIGSVVLSRIGKAYLENEIARGTPFTLEGAKELRRLGILTIVIPIATGVVCFISNIVVELLSENLLTVEAEYSTSINFGLFLLFLSVVFEYGAHIKLAECKERENSNFTEEVSQ